MFAEFVLAARTAPVFAVRPIVRTRVSAAGTTAPRIKNVAAGAAALNSELFIIAKLNDALDPDWLQIVIVERTASVAAGTTYTLVCVLADGLIAPNLLYVCAIFVYIPDNMRIFGSGADTDTFEDEVKRPSAPTTITGICSSPPYVPAETPVVASSFVFTF
jgi:hypothetical protein